MNSKRKQFFTKIFLSLLIILLILAGNKIRSLKNEVSKYEKEYVASESKNDMEDISSEIEEEDENELADIDSEIEEQDEYDMDDVDSEIEDQDEYDMDDEDIEFVEQDENNMDDVYREIEEQDKFSERVKACSWYPKIITELNLCRIDSPMFDTISDYSNPIDLAYMEFLNGSMISSEVTRRGYQEDYYFAWEQEFYHVADLLYETINREEERQQIASYIKSVESYIDSKQTEMIIDVYTCNTTPEEERGVSIYSGNGTTCWGYEEAAYIYRAEALNMIRQYSNYLYDSSDEVSHSLSDLDMDQSKLPQYEYLIKKYVIHEFSDDDIYTSKYFR